MTRCGDVSAYSLEPMNTSSTFYCETCATRTLAVWKGWPHRDAVPLLKRLEAGVCSSCNGTSVLRSERVVWFQYHSEFSTGLPDYWLLKIDCLRAKGRGLPYYAEDSCPKCKGRTVVSEMRYPNGRHELMHNCPSCLCSRVRSITTKVWSRDPSIDKWNKAFERLKGYAGEYGDARPPASFKTEDAFALGTWVIVQRRNKHTLSPARIALLESLLGWVWSLSK